MTTANLAERRLPRNAIPSPALAPLGFQAGDTNLYRYVGNSPINVVDFSGLVGLKITGDPKGSGAFLFELADATEEKLNDPEFKVGDTKIKVRAFKGGKNTVKNPKNKDGSTHSTGYAFVAMSDCKDDIQWLQLASRSFTGGKDRLISIQKEGTDVYYAKKDEWRVDSLTTKSAYVGGESGRAILNGNTGDKDYPFATAFADTPDLRGMDGALTVAFKAKTYLVVRNDIVYTIEWEGTRKLVGPQKWGDAEWKITNSGRGMLNFPKIEQNDKGQWLWARGGGGSPIWIDNPIKKK